jgi:Protein of unknown function (DUF1059)
MRGAARSDMPNIQAASFTMAGVYCTWSDAALACHSVDVVCAVSGPAQTPAEEHTMRAIDCPCGQHLEAETDDELGAKMQEHLDQVHPDMQMTEEEKQAQFAQMVHDV